MILRNIIFIFIINCFLVSCQEDRAIRYDIISKTTSGYAILERNVNPSNTINNYYSKRIYKDSLLLRLEFFNNKSELTDNLYQNAITLFQYDEQKCLKRIENYNKNNEKYENEYLGYWSIEFFFNKNQRLIRKIYKDKHGDLTKFDSNLDIIAPIHEYKYENGNCIEYQLNADSSIIFRNELINYPEIKFDLYLR